jgi:hypothetical protein
MKSMPGRDEAAYLRLVHELLQLAPTEPAEHRRNSRQPFPSFQSIAPLRGANLPAAADFERVRCFDLSTSGFSFLHDQPFPEKKLIVALETASEAMQLTAEVVHETPLVLVGCRFTGRVG